MIMPRLSFEEPKGGPLAKAQPETPVEETQQLSELFVEEEEEEQREGRHRRQVNRDSVLVVLKAATFAVAIALVGSIILLATSGDGDTAAKSPDVPQIADSREPTTGPTTPPAAIVAPEVRSNTTAIAPPPVTQPTVPSTEPPPSSEQSQFVRVGDKCDTRGAYAFTERFEPVVCDARRGNDQLVWRRMFR
jgi:hypothetical protein